MFLYAIAYSQLAPSLFSTKDAWRAWETFCKAVKDGYNVTIRYDGTLLEKKDFANGVAEWSKADGFKNHFHRVGG
jgi:hypothetical protein